jgi:5-methylcytosine-specific restriction protein B
MIAEMMPEAREELLRQVRGASSIALVPRAADGETENAQPTPSPSQPPYESRISEDDPVLRQVLQLINDDKWGGVLLQGSPGTGKTWYAREIAIKLTGGDRQRMREIQFHSSYQYEDFVEGYVPKGSTGFALRDKHLLEMVDIAKRTDGPVVLVIDEFSRTDPARVLGETLTYMESSLRNVEFSLPSGRPLSIPSNLIFLATMNPEDRSVDEIDAAMDRRWAKIQLVPDASKLRDFLRINNVEGKLLAATVEFFVALQRHIEIGHAFFRTVKDQASLRRLWDHQLQYIVKKRFRFDPGAQREISNLWEACLAALGSSESEQRVIVEPAS